MTEVYKQAPKLQNFYKSQILPSTPTNRQKKKICNKKKHLMTLKHANNKTADCDDYDYNFNKSQNNSTNLGKMQFIVIVVITQIIIV